MLRCRFLSCGFVLLIVSMLAACGQSPVPASRPNILLIVADDLGYSDLGVFGSEIATPTIDALATSGAVLTNFHTSANCSPTRAMLLTGVDNHLAGLGNMKELATPVQRQAPGYEGYLNKRVVTIANLLQDGGYQTYLSGKWHLGDKPGFYPSDRGFDRVFALLQGAANHFDQRGYSAAQPTVDYVEDGKPVTLDADFYSSTSYTDRMIEFIEDGTTDKPYFGYLAFTAPHWPLQAPAEAIAPYLPVYAAGWDRIRAARFARMQELGLIPAKMSLPPRWDVVPAWDDLSDDEQQHQAAVMATYAAMTTIMDREVKRLLDFVAARGDLDNTLVIFISDNGATGRDLESYPQFGPWIRENFPEDATPGSANSFLFPGPGWGQVSVTPHRNYKQSSSEGGLRSSMIVSGYGQSQRGLLPAFAQVSDVAMTILDVAGVAHPGTHYQGRDVFAPTGRSLRAYLNGQVDGIYAADEPVAFELNDHAAVYRGPWKAVRLGPPFGDLQWSLYRIDEDQAEQQDRASEAPEVLDSLQQAFRDYAQNVGVVPRQP
jgi:arylsulfatase